MRLAFGFFVGSLVLVGGLFAQGRSPNAGRPDHAVVAVPETFPLVEARAIVWRQERGNEADVILLHPGHADAQTLATAKALLKELRDTPTTWRGDQMVVMTSHTVQGSLDQETVARYRRVLDDLTRRPRVTLGNVGPGRWVELPMTGDRRP